MCFFTFLNIIWTIFLAISNKNIVAIKAYNNYIDDRYKIFDEDINNMRQLNNTIEEITKNNTVEPRLAQEIMLFAHAPLADDYGLISDDSYNDFNLCNR